VNNEAETKERRMKARSILDGITRTVGTKSMSNMLRERQGQERTSRATTDQMDYDERFDGVIV
jgi:hypothetical protein